MVYTLEDFINKCNEVHNNRYDYSETVYVNNKTSLNIICPNHGMFKILPSQHKKGSKCRGCSSDDLKNKKSNDKDFIEKKTKEFIDKAIKVHGNKYDYTKTTYISSKEKLTIICKDHGEFKRIPGDHINKHGCKKCDSDLVKRSINTDPEILKKLTNEFIRRSKEIHGDTYNYDNVIYIKCNIKIKILCLVHGIFNQRPSDHLRSSGCEKCAKKRAGFIQRKSKEQFVIDARKIHGNKYNYDKVEYVRECDKIDIICPNHGVFKQCPNKHLSCRNGCPRCHNKTEGKLNSFLQNLSHIKVISQPTFDWCKKNIVKLPFDFLVESSKLIIELDGDQHFKDVKSWNSFKKDVIQNDIFKMKCAMDNGYTVVRLNQTDIWSDNFDWKDELQEIIKDKRDTPTSIFLTSDKKINIYDDHINALNEDEIIFQD